MRFLLLPAVRMSVSGNGIWQDLSPFRYSAGHWVPFWGGAASTLLPEAIRSALGIAIYGMFLAIIIPPARKLRSVRIVLLLSVILSCLFAAMQAVVPVSSGFVIIICTIAASAFGAWFFPVEEVQHD